jgi:polysaccharide pyruvyl transferase WcaK-like protein
MTLRVLHAATHGHNIGDGALVAGMHATIEEDLGTRLEVTPIDVLGCKLRGRRNMLTESEAACLRGKIDLVLVGGGGMIEGGKGNYLSGLNFNFDPDLIDVLDVPWVFYALGFNQFRHTLFLHRGRLRRVLEHVERRGLLFSVRNDGSRQRLERLLGPQPSVVTIPDPGCFVPTRARPLPELDPDRRNVLVQLAGDRFGQRFGSGASRLGRSLRGRDPIRNLAAILAGIVDRHAVQLVLCPHLLVDLRVLSSLVEALPQRVVRESTTLGPVLNGAGAAPDFFELYRRADLVIGMRGHSAICSVGVGTPFIGLASHDKVGGFLDEVGLPEWSVDIDRDPTLRGLPALLDRALAGLDQYRARIERLRPVLRQQTRDFHARIGRLLGR